MKQRPLHTAVVTALGVGALVAASNGYAADVGAKVYGDVAIALVTASKTTTGGDSSYGLYDNVSLLGVKGVAGEANGIKYIYDYNAILDVVNGGGGLGTHLGILGIEGGFGTVTVGRDNGLFENMVDGSTYVTNWFYTTGMSSLQVGQSIKYVSANMGGFQAGVQLFDFGKSAAGGETTTNVTLAGSFAISSFTIGAGFTKYSDYADGATQYSASGDTNQFGASTNSFAGINLKSVFGISGAYKSDAFSAAAAINSRKPDDGNANDSAINTLMLAGTFAVAKGANLAATISSTTQGSSGVKGTVITFMGSYMPVDNVMYSVELQSTNKDANANGLDGTLGGTKAGTSLAFGAAYTF